MRKFLRLSVDGKHVMRFLSETEHFQVIVGDHICFSSMSYEFFLSIMVIRSVAFGAKKFHY